MGFRFRKSVKLGKHVKINFNKNSVSTTFGTKGMHYTVSSNGRKTKTVGIPGTGLYYTETSSGNKKNSNTVNNNGAAMNTKNINTVTYFFITFFLGILGVHKFIDGKIGQGILYLFTGGLFGIGWIIDVVKALQLLINESNTNNTNFSGFQNSQSNNYNNDNYQQPQNDICKYCGGIIDNQTKKCMNCGKPKNASNLSVILWLIFFCPVGLYLMLKKTDWNKTLKIVLSAVYGCWIAFCIFFFAVGIFADSPTEEAANTDNSTTSITEQSESQTKTSNEKLSEIMKQAETDAKNSTDTDDEKAVKYLSDNINNCFESDETMEKFIYYGAFLDSKYEDDNALSKIGFQAVITVKYVYRDVEDVTDSATVNNVKELRNMLDEYNNSATSTTKISTTKATTTETTKKQTTTAKRTTTTEPAATEEHTTTYIINTNSGKFHYSGCRAVKEMNESNKMTFEGTRDEVIAKGYVPCGICKP